MVIIFGPFNTMKLSTVVELAGSASAAVKEQALRFLGLGGNTVWGCEFMRIVD